MILGVEITFVQCFRLDSLCRCKVNLDVGIFNVATREFDVALAFFHVTTSEFNCFFRELEGQAPTEKFY